MTDTVTLSAAAFFWLMFGMMVISAGVTWLAIWAHERRRSTAAIEAAERELAARTADLPGAVRIERPE